MRNIITMAGKENLFNFRGDRYRNKYLQGYLLTPLNLRTGTLIYYELDYQTEGVVSDGPLMDQPSETYGHIQYMIYF